VSAISGVPVQQQERCGFWLLLLLNVSPSSCGSMGLGGTNGGQKQQGKTQEDIGNAKGPGGKGYEKVSAGPPRLQELVDFGNALQESDIFLSQLQCFGGCSGNIKIHGLQLSCDGGDKVVGGQIVGGALGNSADGGKSDCVGGAAAREAGLEGTLVDGAQTRPRVHPGLCHDGVQASGMTAGFGHNGEQEIGLLNVSVRIVIRIVKEFVQSRSAVTAR